METKNTIKNEQQFVDSFEFNCYWNMHEYSVEINQIDDAIENRNCKLSDDKYKADTEYIYSVAQL